LLKPGHRVALSRKAGLTPSDDATKSHLFTFGEYCAMYLFGWNQYLWPATLPTFAQVRPGEPEEVTVPDFAGPGERVKTQEFRTFEEERESTRVFRDSIVAARRALANVSTYMVLDDHEATDDFLLNRLWCERVLGNALGRRVVQNALASFALFQAWGNDPDQFKAGRPGGQLLDTLKSWTRHFGEEYERTLQALLRIVRLEGTADSLPAPQPAEHLVWHFKAVGSQHRVLAFDTRTVRKYRVPKQGERAETIALRPAAVVSPAAILSQLQEFGPSAAETRVTFVVLTLPFVPTPIIEVLQKFVGDFIPNQSQELGAKAAFFADFEGFEYDTDAYQRLFAGLAALGPIQSNKRKTRIVLLSGDIHFTYCARMSYWAVRPFGTQSNQATEAVVAQLVSSSLKNQDGQTRFLGLIGFLPVVGLPSQDDFAGWRNPGGGVLEVGTRTFVGPGQPQKWTVKHTPAIAELNERAVIERTYSTPPDWRYRIAFLRGEDNVKRLEADTFGTEIVTAIPATDPVQALQEAVKAARNHRFYFVFLAPGREIAGSNNLCHVFFAGDDTDNDPLKVVQESWFFLGKLADPEPLTRWEVSLAFDPEPPL
jgi:hypothetical protein